MMHQRHQQHQQHLAQMAYQQQMLQQNLNYNSQRRVVAAASSGATNTTASIPTMPAATQQQVGHIFTSLCIPIVFLLSFPKVSCEDQRVSSLLSVSSLLLSSSSSSSALEVGDNNHKGNNFSVSSRLSKEAELGVPCPWPIWTMLSDKSSHQFLMLSSCCSL